MAKIFRLIITRVGENLYDGEAISVSAPGREGIFQILADHEAFVSELVQGEVRVNAADATTYDFAIPGNGIIEVSRNQVTILL